MRRNWPWMLTLLAAIIIRLVSLSAYPLHDTTEARYSEIARLMVASNDWWVPQIAPGNPFWAKPPLSIWATAASLKLLGATEFAARLPALLFSLIAVVLVFHYCSKRYSDAAAWVAATTFFCSGVGFIGAGAVMTDSALTLSVTISVIAFASRIGQEKGRVSGFAFFFGIALGLLAKGPIAAVLVGIPVLLWTLRYKSLLWLWTFLPWGRGLLLVCLLALPWYVIAEVRSPGFLQYFVVGEHFYRFIDSGWSGDLYGNGHSRPLGTIWVFALIGLFPWSFLCVYVLFKWRSKSQHRDKESLDTRFLLLAALAPLLFFSFAKNILPAYVMPSLPALAVLCGKWLEHRARSLALLGATVPAIFLTLFVTGVVAELDNKSQKQLLETLAEEGGPRAVFYFERMPHSASFYSKGETVLIPNREELEEVLAQQQDGVLLVLSKNEQKLGPNAHSCLSFKAVTNRYTIFSIGRCVGLADNPFSATR